MAVRVGFGMLPGLDLIGWSGCRNGPGVGAWRCNQS